MEPRAEITMASVIQFAAVLPLMCVTTSEAIWGEAATVSKGRTFKHAALNTR